MWCGFGRDLAECLERLTSNAKVAEVLGSSRHPPTQWDPRGGRWSSVEREPKKNYVQRKCCVTFREWGNMAGLWDITSIHPAEQGEKGERVKAKISFRKNYTWIFFFVEHCRKKCHGSINTNALTQLVRVSARFFAVAVRNSKKLSKVEESSRELLIFSNIWKIFFSSTFRIFANFFNLHFSFAFNFQPERRNPFSVKA